MIKESIHQEDVTIITIRALNNRIPKYMKKKWTEIVKEIGN